MAFVPPIRNFFLIDDNYKNIKRPPGDIMFPLGRRKRVSNLSNLLCITLIGNIFFCQTYEYFCRAFLLVQRFGELVRKIWNPRNFKCHVSPHEMLQVRQKI